jgi:CheY-like chemotaxis protein/prolyl-tRNA editing enzyme YbaK/EbsC (Cys-tRNA(Pro) deacylase)
MAVPHWLQRILAHYEVPFQEHPHPPAFTAPLLAQTLHVSGHRVAKTVFFAGHDHPIAVVLPAHTSVDPARVAAVLGRGPIRFASEADMAGWFKGCEPGAVPPLRLRGDERILMDRSLAHFGHIVFPAGQLDLAISVRFRDWYRMVRPGMGRFGQAVNGHQSAPRPARTVLVVEDEVDTNKLFCQLLEKEGYTCRSVPDGSHAVALASEAEPAAILLDLMLPDMDGFQVVQQLRRSGPLKRTPVIVVTALDDQATRDRGQQMGAEAYLTKPFAPQTLVQEFREILADAEA